MILAQRVFVSLLAVLALISRPLPVAAQTWTALGPAGGQFSRIFVAPSQPTTLFANAGDGGGLYKSTNSGDTWQSVSAGMAAGSCDIHVSDLAIHPTQPNTIFAATQALGVCKSTDGGTTWTQSIAGLPNDANSFQRPVLSIAINPQTPTVIFAGTEAGVYMSVNSGSNWTLSGAVNQSGASNQAIVSVAFAPSSANTAYAYAKGTVFKTSDGGTTWAPTGNLSPATNNEGLLTVSPASPNTVFLVVEDNVYRTTNGNSWAVSTAGATGAFFYGNVSIDPTNTNTMFLTAAGSCGLCKSTDGGTTWTTVNPTGLPSGFGTTNLIITTTLDSATPSRMFGGTPFGAYRSTNSGVTWSSVSTGLNGLSIGAMGLGGGSPAGVFIGTDSATGDGADILKLVGGVLPFANLGNVVSGGRLTDVVVDPTSSNTIYAVGGKSNNQNCGQIYKSTNGGVAWTAINPSTVPGTLCAGSLVMDPSTPATLYLGVQSQSGGTQSAVVYKTTNGGSSWTSVSAGLSFGVQRIVVSKRTPALLYAGSINQVFKSTNGGGSWSSAGSGLPNASSNSSGGGGLAIDPTDDNIVYFATSQGIYGTTNGGTSWTAKRGGWPTIHGVFFGANALAIDPNTTTTLYASTSTPSPGPVSSFSGQSALGTGLYKSTDSGATWTSASDVLAGVNVSNVVFDGTRIYAATNNGVFKFAVTTTSTVTLSRSALNFAATSSGTALTSQTAAQSVRLSVGSGSGVTWTATSDKPWLTVTPGAGTGTASLAVAVRFDATLPASGQVTGNITFALTGAGNTVGPIAVTFNVVSSTAAASVPFGSFDTPAGDLTVLAGSVAVTGWTLDNIGVSKVEIWRAIQPGETNPPSNTTPGDPRNGKIFIANATFVENARGDVEGLYPNVPANYRAGWGYLMLTWGLFAQGNGTYTFYAFGVDQEGNTATIGTKTVIISNSTATRPFGSIDSPAIGGNASGLNQGWGLTPKVNGVATCKIQPSGVQYSIDSGPLQPVIYGDGRLDVAGLFQGFSNSAAPGGHATIDWAALTDATHTIVWLLTDDCNRADGVGSRYFNNPGGTALRAAETGFAVATPSLFAASRAAETESGAAITVARGYGELPEILDPGVAGSRTIEMKQGERIELRVPRGFESAYQLGPNGERRALPVGSTWDAGSQTFYWQPAPGFLGRFRLVFSNGSERISVRVVIQP